MFIPIDDAACWSSATARIAIPNFENLKNTENMMSKIVTMINDHKYIGAIVTLEILTGVAGNMSGNDLGCVPQIIVTTPPSKLDNPIVAIITETTGASFNGLNTNLSTPTPTSALNKNVKIKANINGILTFTINATLT